MGFGLHRLPGKLLGPGKGKQEVVYNSGKNDERERGVIKGIVHTGNNPCNYPCVLIQSYFPFNR